MSEKISQMTSGNPAQTGDLIPIARSGANYAVTAQSIAALGGGTWENWLGSNASGMTGLSFNFSSSVNFGLAMAAVNSSRQLGGTPTATEISKIIVQPASLTSSGGLLDAAANLTLGILKQWFTSLEINGATDARFWVGITDQTSSEITTVFFSDTPSGANFVGFRFSTSAGDTTWQAVCFTPTGMTVVDTGIAPTSVRQMLKVVPGSGSVGFYINGTLVATVSTNLPTSATAMSSLITADNLNNVSSTTEFSWCYTYAQIAT